MQELKKRTGFEVFDGNLTDHKKDIEEGNPIIVEVRDLADFNRKIVKAVISRARGSVADGVDLWFKDQEDKLVLEPGSIKVIEEMEEDD